MADIVERLQELSRQEPKEHRKVLEGAIREIQHLRDKVAFKEIYETQVERRRIFPWRRNTRAVPES